MRVQDWLSVITWMYSSDMNGSLVSEMNFSSPPHHLPSFSSVSNMLVQRDVCDFQPAFCAFMNEFGGEPPALKAFQS